MTSRFRLGRRVEFELFLRTAETAAARELSRKCITKAKLRSSNMHVPYFVRTFEYADGCVSLPVEICKISLHRRHVLRAKYIVDDRLTAFIVSESAKRNT